MAIVKPKISSIVSSQLPEFVREDYQTFIAFLEAYYSYLEQNVIVDYKTIGDIDSTLDSFITYFKSELGLNFPATLLDDKFLLPKLKELYVSKGTEASYRLLFRLLYNKEIDIIYPSKQILKPSDGKWNQDISIFADISFGDPNSIVGKYVNIETIDKKIKVFIDRYVVTSGRHEFFITGGWTGTFSAGDFLKYDGSFFATILSTTSTLQVLQAGRNFRVGQIYDIVGSVGSGSKLQITSVNADGGIKTARFISFGTGYSVDFYLSLLASGANNNANFFAKNGTAVDINDSMSELADSGYADKYDYALDGGTGWVEATYVGDIIATFSATTGNNTIDPNDYAVLSIKQGAVAKYPGYYKNNDGFLNDTMYIQDSKYYQAFSYVIKVDELFDSYKSIVKNILHPAGTEVFSEYTINNYASISATCSGYYEISYLYTENNFRLTTESGDPIILDLME